MVKKRGLKGSHFTVGIIGLVVVIIVLFSIVALNRRFAVTEGEGIVDNPIIAPGEPLSYKTEFCANKLTDLAHEIHFLEKDIARQKSIEEELMLLPEMEGEVISIEQREISIIRDEFDEYKGLCDQLDKEPTADLCERFIDEAKQELDLAQENAAELENKSFLERLEPHAHNLRTSQRVYLGLKEHCRGVI